MIKKKFQVKNCNPVTRNAESADIVLRASCGRDQFADPR